MCVVVVPLGVAPTVARPLWVGGFKAKRGLSVLMDDHDLVLIIGNFRHARPVVLVEMIALLISGRSPAPASNSPLTLAVVKLNGREVSIKRFFSVRE